MSWQAIEKVMILGTERMGLPGEVGDIVEHHFPGQAWTNEEKLLAALSLMSRLRKGAGVMEKREDLILTEVEKESQRPLHPKSIHHFNLILDGTYLEALPEFVELVITDDRCFPPEGLPQLLNQCLEEPGLYSLIAPALGKRGRWLIGLHPDWSTLDPVASEEDWQNQDISRRATWLKVLRKHDPDRAIELLKEVWDQMKHAHKLALLDTLVVDLSLADEPFLEQCLEDGRKEIRKKVAGFLWQLPDSALQKRLHEFAAHFIQISDRGIISLELPNELPEQIVRKCGIEKSPKKKGKFGKKANWLFQVFSKITPSFWESYFQKDRRQVLAAFYASEWRDLLIGAISDATLLHEDEDWMDALSGLWVRVPEAKLWNNRTARELMAIWPDDLFNRRCIAHLQHHPHLLDEYGMVTFLLRNGRQKWQDKLTVLVIRNFQNWLSSSHAVPWRGLHYREILKTAAYRANPQLLEVVQRGWQTNAGHWEFWEQDVKHLSDTLFFRKELREMLKKK